MAFILLFVVTMGLISGLVGLVRLVSPKGYAMQLAKQANRAEVTDEDLKKTRTHAITLLVLGVFCVSLLAVTAFVAN